MRFYAAEERDAVRTAMRRGTIQKIDDSGSQQIVKRARGGASEEFEDIYRPQPHGFTSHPPANSEFLVMALGGRSDRMLALGGEHKDHRFKNLPEGATAIYNANGSIATLIGQEIKIKSAGKITLESPQIVLEGTCYLGGADAVKEASMRDTIDTGGFKDVAALATKVFVK